MKVDNAGNIFATGPGGVLVISAAGEHLGTISTGEITANVGWGRRAARRPLRKQNALYDGEYQLVLYRCPHRRMQSWQIAVVTIYL